MFWSLSFSSWSHSATILAGYTAYADDVYVLVMSNTGFEVVCKEIVKYEPVIGVKIKCNNLFHFLVERTDRFLCWVCVLYDEGGNFWKENANEIFLDLGNVHSNDGKVCRILKNESASSIVNVGSCWVYRSLSATQN